MLTITQRNSQQTGPFSSRQGFRLRNRQHNCHKEVSLRTIYEDPIATVKRAYNISMIHDWYSWR